MPRMIPPVIRPETPSSERRVFDAISGAKDAESWIVLHSLGIANSWLGEYGEVDFVVMMPGIGVVCIEVKGGGVRVTDGVWTTRNARDEVNELRRSPFKQAQDGMWKLHQIVKERFGNGSDEARCPFGWLVIFPDVDCPPLSPEFTREEVVDRTDLADDLRRRIQEAPSLRSLVGRADLRPPSKQVVQNILKFLRPSFERIAMPTVEGIENSIAALTEEQYAVLDGIADNRICLVKGPAGTGKTMLAIEAARRATAGNQTVMLTCFNRNLGKWLADSTAGFGPGRVVVGNVHAILRERILRSSLADDLRKAEAANADPRDLYSRIYFELGALAVEELGEKFNLLLVDETQDFPPEGLREVVNAWAPEKFGGRSILFGDFTRQALYESGGDPRKIGSAFGSIPTFLLSLNCRNTKRIAIQTELMTGFTGIRTSEKQVDGNPVEIEYVADELETVKTLDHIVARLRESGFKPDQVVILGGRQRRSSSVANAKEIGGWALKDIDTAKPGDLVYSTIHSFKGLERPAVIMIDAATDLADETDALLYVGMSRARLRLFLVCSEASRAAFDHRIAEGTAKLMGAKT